MEAMKLLSHVYSLAAEINDIYCDYTFSSSIVEPQWLYQKKYRFDYAFFGKENIYQSIQQVLQKKQNLLTS